MTAIAPTGRTEWRWLPFVAGSFGFFVIMAGATMPVPLFPIYAETYGFSPLIITLIFAVYCAGVIGALLGFGPWSDQIGRKPLLLAGLAVAALAAVTFAVSDGLALILAARVLQGLSVGLFTATATVAVNEMAPEGRARAGELGATVANLGGLGAGSIIAGVLITALPAPLVSPYLVHLGFVAMAIALLMAVPEPGTPREDPHLHAQGLRVPREVRGLFVPAAISAFAGFMICGFLGAVGPGYLGEVFDRGGQHILIGFLPGAIFLTACLGNVLEVYLPGDRVLTIGVGVLTLGVAAITAALAIESLPALIAAVLFAGFGQGISFKGGLTRLGAEAPADEASAVTASYFVVGYTALAIPTLSIGVAQGPLGLVPSALGYGVIATVLSGAAFVQLIRLNSKG